jgi:hypothetical protein
VAERGPIHEGFAQPGAIIRGKGLTAPVAPPAPVDEVPPTPKPEGANVRFLSGYWQWDGDKNDFVWVCGCYRTTPPERTWEPGYWQKQSDRWTYFPGYWRPTDIKTLRSNLPEPPASTEEAPGAPNNPNAMWVPGQWEYGDGKFVWQAGYWPASFGNLMWQPGQYVVTETGFASVPGHWDYPLEERGVLYTPVYFSRAQRTKFGWAYRPEQVLSFGSETKWGEGGTFESLSIGPDFNSYFYGIYPTGAGASLAPVFALWALVPGFGGPQFAPSVSESRRAWDSVSRGYTNPLWQHYLRLNREGSGWVKATGSSAAAQTNGRTNPLAFVEPGLGCHPSGAVGVPIPTSTVTYQRVSRNGSVTTGSVSYGWAPPVSPGRHRR